MSLQTPRILSSHLQAFHGGQKVHTVRILGTVTALHGQSAVITCGDHGTVTLLLQPDSHLQMGKLTEVVGKVTQLDGGQVRNKIISKTVSDMKCYLQNGVYV